MGASDSSHPRATRPRRAGANMARSVGAVLIGFAATMLLVMLTTALAAVAFGAPMVPSPEMPTREPATGYLIANLVGSLLSAVAGGWLAARVAGRHAVEHALALAMVIFVLSLLSLRPGPGQPAWYPYALMVIGPVGAVIGGMIRRGSAVGVRARDA